MRRGQYQSTQKEERAKQAIAHLKQKFPDQVLGRLSDLVKPNNAKYNIAITVLMGRQMDSVVVRTMEAAKKCVGELKSDRLKTEPMEFIPLDTIDVRACACRHCRLMAQRFSASICDCGR